MEEDTKNKEYFYWNDEWNGVWIKDDFHTKIMLAETTNNIINLNNGIRNT